MKWSEFHRGASFATAAVCQYRRLGFTGRSLPVDIGPTTKPLTKTITELRTSLLRCPAGCPVTFYPSYSLDLLTRPPPPLYYCRTSRPVRVRFRYCSNGFCDRTSWRLIKTISTVKIPPVQNICIKSTSINILMYINKPPIEIVSLKKTVDETMGFR